MTGRFLLPLRCVNPSGVKAETLTGCLFANDLGDRADQRAELASIRAEVDAGLRTWREVATHVLALAMAATGPVILLYFWMERSFALPRPAQAIAVSFYGLIVAAASIPRRHYRLRATMLLGVFYGTAGAQLTLAGLVGNGRMILLAVPLLALVLLGRRAGWVTAALSALIMVAVTLLAGAGILSRWQLINENSLDPFYWLFQGFMLLGILVPLMILLTLFLNLQMKTMLAERQARRAQDHFSRQLITAQENERHRIAGELHDGLGQDLLVIANQAQLGLAKTGDSVDTATRLTEIAETARNALQQARRMAHNLRPGLLEELGFTEAVEASVEKAGHASGMLVKMNLANVDGLLPPEFEVNLFRILQEALNNILKHAAATETRVTLVEEATALRLIVEDNGRGFDLAALQRTDPGQRGLGLRQMSERAGMMGGRVDLQSLPGQGTRLVVEVPLKDS